MKKPIVSRTIIGSIAASFVLAQSTAVAMPKLSREKCGVVQRIDRETRTLVIRPADSEEPLIVIWKERTRFVRNGEFDSAASLAEGEHACVRYRSPLFGKKFATRVLWNNREEPDHREERTENIRHSKVLFVDQATHSVVVKPDQPTKRLKPLGLNRNKDTQFIQNGETVAATDLKPGISAVMHYKRLSFRNPLLKKVIWETNPSQHQRNTTQHENEIQTKQSHN